MAIAARTWEITNGAASSEQANGRREVSVPFDVDEAALVVIDPWASHPNEGWSARMMINLPNLHQVTGLFRSRRRPIFYDSTGLPIHPMLLEGAGSDDHFIEWDQMGGGTDVLNGLLIEHGIRTIFWAGYTANICLMAKPCG